MKVNQCITFIIHAYCIIILYGCTSKALHTYTRVIFTTCMLGLADRKMFTFNVALLMHYSSISKASHKMQLHRGRPMNKASSSYIQAEFGS